MKKGTKLYYFVLLFSGIQLLFSCSLSKAFEAIEVYDYFGAKTNFEKAEKRHPVAAKYGLSIIQQRNDNPFYNIDSAYANIAYAVVYYDSLKPKTKLKYAKIGADSLSIIKQQHLIATDLYGIALKENEEESFQRFIRKNPTSSWVSKAIFYRDSLGLEKATNKNTAASYQAFMNKYPTSVFLVDAKSGFERQLYIEHTSNDKLQEYDSFMNQYPDNPFVIDAENQIFRIMTASRTVKSYESFINTYPNNRNNRKAWEQLYDAYLSEYFAEDAIASFIRKYPNNPFKDKIEGDLALSKTIFYPVQQNNQWGFKSREGKYVINSSYSFVESFTEGLAVVGNDDKLGYITKSGAVKIDLIFDDALPFSEGCAVVEVNGKYGLINRQGEFIIPAEYTYLGQLKNGLIPFEKNEFYGYFDKKGQVKIATLFEEATNFEEGKAKVSINGKWGMVNTEGEFIFKPIYDNIKELDANVYALKDNDSWGALSVGKDTVIDFKYDAIEFPSAGYYMVTKLDSFNYVNKAGDLLLKDAWQPTYPDYKIMAKYTGSPVLVLEEDGYNYMTISGKMVFRKPKDLLGIYSSEIAYLSDDLWGYLSPLPAKEIIKPQFDRAYSFENGFGIVSLSPLWGMIDVNGEFVINAYYEDLSFLTTSLIIAKGKGKYGILNTQGDTILPFEYQKIEPFDAELVKVSNQGMVSYYNFKANSWIRKEE